LRQIVINCYKYHGREDLIPVFNEEEEKRKEEAAAQAQQQQQQHQQQQIVNHTGKEKVRISVHFFVQVRLKPIFGLHRASRLISIFSN
jgi:hypothetical protein